MGGSCSIACQGAQTTESGHLWSPPAARSWIDVETNPSSGCGWGSNLAQNCAYIGQLLDAVKSHGIKPGVYAR